MRWGSYRRRSYVTPTSDLGAHPGRLCLLRLLRGPQIRQQTPCSSPSGLLLSFCFERCPLDGGQVSLCRAAGTPDERGSGEGASKSQKFIEPVLDHFNREPSVEDERIEGHGACRAVILASTAGGEFQQVSVDPRDRGRDTASQRISDGFMCSDERERRIETL